MSDIDGGVIATKNLIFLAPLYICRFLLPGAGDNTGWVFYSPDDKGKFPGVWFSPGFV